jgi:hypothetical protein
MRAAIQGVVQTANRQQALFYLCQVPGVKTLLTAIGRSFYFGEPHIFKASTKNSRTSRAKRTHINKIDYDVTAITSRSSLDPLSGLLITS